MFIFRYEILFLKNWSTNSSLALTNTVSNKEILLLTLFRIFNDGNLTLFGDWRFRLFNIFKFKFLVFKEVLLG